MFSPLTNRNNPFLWMFDQIFYNFLFSTWRMSTGSNWSSSKRRRCHFSSHLCQATTWIPWMWQPLSRWRISRRRKMWQDLMPWREQPHFPIGCSLLQWKLDAARRHARFWRAQLPPWLFGIWKYLDHFSVSKKFHGRRRKLWRRRWDLFLAWATMQKSAMQRHQKATTRRQKWYQKVLEGLSVL